MHLASFISCLAVVFSSFALVEADETQPISHYSQQEELTSHLISRVWECILFNPEIPRKQVVFNLLQTLESKKVVTEMGSEDLRVKYVAIQGAFEHVLARALDSGEIDYLVGVIHTPTPATPLCTEVDPFDEEPLDPFVRFDFDLQKCVAVRGTRPFIVRNFLDKGGKLFIAYPQGGFEKRSVQQQQVYQQELNKYQDNLIDTVLNCTEFDPSKVGAIYFFKRAQGNMYVFSIKSYQAITPQEFSEWGLWLGKMKNKVVNARVVEILDYLSENGGPNLEALGG